MQATTRLDRDAAQFVLTDQANVAAQRLYGATGATIEEDQSMLFVYRGHAA